MNATTRTIGSSTAAALVAVLLGRSANGVRSRRIDTVEARYESRAMNHEWG